MKNKISENYLEKIPMHSAGLKWSENQDGLITLEVVNKGIANRIAQIVFKKPKISYIHLDLFGSFVWLQIDKKRNIIAIGECVKNHFGEKAEPLYERLAQYFKNLKTYGFIDWLD